MCVYCDWLKDNDILLFVHGLNAAFLKRQSNRIPYQPMDVSTMKQEFCAGVALLGLYRDQALVGGLALSDVADDTVKISHVWIDPAMQGQGLSKTLLIEVEDAVRDHGASRIVLSVANSYKPAVHLYRKMGYQAYGVTANVPNTYYFVNMEKRIKPRRIDRLIRCCQYCWAKCKFSLLFDKYSTPKLIHRMIFGNKMCTSESENGKGNNE